MLTHGGSVRTLYAQTKPSEILPLRVAHRPLARALTCPRYNKRGSPPRPPMYNAWLHRYTILLAVCTLFLVIAGAAVTSHEAGLSVPDWPLSYGKLMPPMIGGIFYEHGHRMVATTVGMLTIVLAIWLWRTDRRRWMRRLGFIALVAVIAQGLLGGATVIFMLPKP